MLLELKVRNVRKLRDETFTFTPGLNVVRGANEQGKSTMLECITYALFGVKGCRTSLADMVTWGEAENTLKVTLKFVVEGVVYDLSRSKAGAEIRWTSEAGPQETTGQTEVTLKIGRLLGIAPANINRLMLSGQGDIRGALDQGPQKTSELIESLSNFDIIDRVVKLIGEHLLTGSTTPFEDKIARLEPELSRMEEQLGSPPDTAFDEGQIGLLEQAVELRKVSQQEALDALKPATTARDAAKAVMDQGKVLVSLHSKAYDSLTNARAALATLEDKPCLPADGVRILALQGLLADMDKLAILRAQKAEIAALPKAEMDWEGDMASFNAEASRVKLRSQEVQKQLNELSADARVQRGAKIVASACGICGQDVSSLPQVAEKNAAITARLAEISGLETTLKAEFKDLVETAGALDGIRNAQAKVELLLAKYGDVAQAVTTHIPYSILWVGPALPDTDGNGALRLELNALNRQNTEATVWSTRVESKKAEVTKLDKEVADLTIQCQDPALSTAVADHGHWSVVCDQLNERYSALVSANYKDQQERTELTAKVAAAKATYENAKAQVDKIRDQLAEAKADLDKVEFNNALLKQVRAARPVIANKLWTMVLSAVSRYFSAMRGQDSLVTKDGDGFKVNGSVLGSLSGSTLDILGLAIRLALVKTFLPHAPFLILDEPSAACDGQRTSAMMGFLVGAGFDQLLVVTHEDISEQAAEQLIEI